MIPTIKQLERELIEAQRETDAVIAEIFANDNGGNDG